MIILTTAAATAATTAAATAATVIVVAALEGVFYDFLDVEFVHSFHLPESG
ncbi:MAG: hypothetical protein IMF26_02605 [Candidatus Fermentithermobacillus carboniphilus]|uniref:Uncharacterized protein n=1 Tax=Candidatus Fermentithermobacillus carboniphilus TaxID=3085328 RepID=A0AAT9LD49_9FIRM|nr:MAG: hypothetical protein IMF26_02605 [Candidatus Fermentithermobacillus carboniphilus]